jgi:enediyne polyketide synthase
MSKKTDIAVIGMSCYYPGAKDLKSFWQNILAKRQQFRDLPDVRLPLSSYWHPDKTHPDTTYGKKAALIDDFTFDWQKRKIPKTAFESTDIVHWLALETALEALKDANLDITSMPKDNTGVIIGNSLTGEFTRSENMRLRWPYVNKVLKKTSEKFGWNDAQLEKFAAEMEVLYKSVFAAMNEDSLAGGLSNTIAGRVCNFCDFHGGGYVVDGACSSSLLAIITAANSLVNGDMDIALAGGVDISLDTFELVGFSKAGALTDKEMKVYDENRSGFIPGEGCGFIVLKRLEDAQNDGDKIYATIKGWGISSDGKGGMTAPNSIGQSTALIRALQKAELSPNQINFIEGHGTGTVVGDNIELEGIKLAFEKLGGNQIRKCAITSAKSIIGHTKAAAGIAAFIKTVIALNQRVIPPTAGITKPHSFFKSPLSPLYPSLKAQKYSDDEILYAGVSAMGFGGINTHVILSSADFAEDKFRPSLLETQLSASSQNSEIFVFSAISQTDLLKQLKKIKEDSLGISICELADLAKFISNKVDNKKSYKCALVVNNSEELSKIIEEAINYLQENKLKANQIYKDEKFSLWLSFDALTPEIGFVFPGQGSQKLGSASLLIERFPWAEKIAKQFDKINNGILDKIYPQFSKIIADNDFKQFSDNLSKSDIAQPAIILSSILWLYFLKKLGIEAKAVAGHSLGELMAFYEAGAYDLESLFKITFLRGQSMSSCKEEGKMVSLICDANKAKDLISDIKGVVVANFNSPTQTVISGKARGIEKVIELAQQQDIIFYLLPVANAFHSPLMQEAADNFKSRLEIVKNFNPSKSCFSSMSGKKVEQAINIKNHFAEQITAPVKFMDMIENMTKKIDYIIEVGPGEVLSKLVSKITNNKISCFAVEKSIDDIFNLNLLLADLYVRNIDLKWEELYKERLIYPFILPKERKFITNPLEKSLDKEAGEAINNYNSSNASNQYESIEDQIFQNQALEIKENHNLNQEFLSNDISNQTIEQLLVEIVTEITGFDSNSINLEHKLLSDLNLDSIKSATLIGKIARKLNISQSLINVSSLANSSLQEISDLFRSLDKNSLHINEAENNSNWLKYFAIKDFEESIIIEENFDKLHHKQIAILGWEASKWQKELLKQYEQLGFATIYIDLSKKENLSFLKENHILVIIPPQIISHHDLNIASRIASRIETISDLKDLPFNDLLSLNVIHFNSEISSLFASIHHEHPKLKINLFDITEQYDLQRLISIINTELSSKNKFNNARYIENIKYVSRPVTIDEEQLSKRNISWDKKDVILVSAGAKGITNECIFTWAKNNKIKAKIVLLGRTEGNHLEIQEVIKKFQESKINCYYYPCDITDIALVTKTLNLIKKNLGEITAFVHGAGLNKPRLFSNVNSKEAFLEVSPKVQGLINILNSLDLTNLKLVTAISSIIGYSGMPGNAWYAWSNKTMEKILARCQQQYPNIQICSIGYSIWDEVGMGVRMGSVAQLSQMGIAAISKEEGINSFNILMTSRSNNNNYIVTSRLGTLDTWNRLIPQKPQANRFLEKIISFEPQIELICQSYLTLEKDLYLQDHNFNGSILFPTVFGLEAMAQAAAYVSAIDKFNSAIEINNIDLNKPIVVDAKQGLNIQIKALVKKGGSITVSISTEESNFTVDHFKSEFNLDKVELVNLPIFKLSDQPLKLIPKKDLYGSLLFQGPLFQKMENIYHLSGEKIIYRVIDDSKLIPFSNSLTQDLILGNPFTRDVLLQSAQLCLPDQQVLPIKIEKIIVNQLLETEFFAKNVINSKQSNGEIKSSVIAINKNGEILEYLKNYIVMPVGEITKPGLTPKDVVNPSNYDEKFLNNQLKEFGKVNDLDIPVIKLKYIDNLIQFKASERHKKEQPLFKNAVTDLFTQNGEQITDEDFKISWEASGKPIMSIKKHYSFTAHISMAHDERLCIATAAKYQIGCDIEPIINRSEEEWQDLLFDNIMIWQKLSQIIDTDTAATIIWTIKESIIKSGLFTNLKYDLSLVNNEKNNFLFIVSKTNTNDQILILSTIFNGLRPLKRVFSCIVDKKDQIIISNSKQEILVLSKNNGVINDVFTCKQRGAFGEEVYIHRFRTTFRDANNIDRTLSYPIFATWMGKLRELPLDSIAADLITDMTSGKWGMVTNNSYIKIVGEAGALDLIEGHFWINKIYGQHNSTIDLAFKWFKVNNDGSLSIIAYSFLPTTWVKVTGHGTVDVHPFPSYFQKWVDNIIIRNNNLNYLEEIKNYPHRYEIGELLFKNKNFPNHKKALHCSYFSTSLDESNLVGNIYYANYYKWQSKTFDQFINKIDPNFYFYNENHQKFVCLETEINHLQEAMPFDTIQVKLYIDAIYESGFSLIYEFFKGEENKSNKLAWGKQKMAFAKQYDNSSSAYKISKYMFDCFASNV